MPWRTLSRSSAPPDAGMPNEWRRPAGLPRVCSVPCQHRTRTTRTEHPIASLQLKDIRPHGIPETQGDCSSRGWMKISFAVSQHRQTATHPLRTTLRRATASWRRISTGRAPAGRWRPVPRPSGMRDFAHLGGRRSRRRCGSNAGGGTSVAARAAGSGCERKPCGAVPLRCRIGHANAIPVLTRLPALRIPSAVGASAPTATI